MASPGGQQEPEGKTMTAYVQQRDGYYYEVVDGMCIGRPMTADELVFHNTSAVAMIDGDPVATIHASEIADVLAAYSRSAALVVDIADLHMLRRVLAADELDNEDRSRAARLYETINDAFNNDLR